MDKLIINDIPLTELGAVLAPDSYKSALQWAKFKSITSNDWAECNYVEYDLEKPTLDKRTVTLNFHAKGEEGYRTFIDYLLSYVYSYYEFPELGITLRLRVDTNSVKNINGTWQSFSITFIDDEPYRQVSAVPTYQDFPQTGYSIDGYDLSVYGISILQGSLQTIVQNPQVKERLSINEKSFDGAIYDSNGEIRLRTQTITLKCLLRAATLQVAVANYFYLLELFRQSGTRRLYVTEINHLVDCFYNSCTVNAVHDKLSSGNAGIAFDIQLNISDKFEITRLSNDNGTKLLEHQDESKILILIKN